MCRTNAHRSAWSTQLCPGLPFPKTINQNACKVLTAPKPRLSSNLVPHVHVHRCTRTNTDILQRYFNTTWGQGTVDKISLPGTDPECCLWFTLCNPEQPFVLSHTDTHTLTEPGSAVALPVTPPPKSPSDEAVYCMVKWTMLAKNALFEDSECDNYCHYQGGDLKKDNAITAVVVHKRVDKPWQTSQPLHHGLDHKLFFKLES